ncbi:MAG: alpha/beta fold hydrolase, partial [Roseobacter sp.]
AGLLAPERLSRLKMPVLLIEGDQSPVIISAIHQALKRRLPQARRDVVTGAGHMVPLTHPKPVASLLRSFLEVA